MRHGFVLVISAEPLDATTTLFFGQRLGLENEAIRVVRYDRRHYASLLAAANAVILVRGLFEFADITRCSHALRTPIYYFLDDNFMVLKKAGGVDARFVQSYADSRVRDALSGFAGVLLATTPLVDDFVERRLHPRLRLYPPMMSAGAPAPHPHPESPLRVAFFGGRHVHAFFRGTILPALRRMAALQPVRLTAFGIDATIEPSEGLSIVHEPYAASYEAGTAALAAAGVDILLHALAPGVANNAFKNPHALITAHAIGAVPIVSRAAPYHEALAAQAAFVCDDSEESWYRQIRSAAMDRQVRQAVRDRLAVFCRERFDGSINRQVLRGILEMHPSPHAMWRPLRGAAAAAYLQLSRAGTAASRLARMRGVHVRVTLP